MKRLGLLFIASFFVLLQSTQLHVRAETVLPANIVINEIQTNGQGSGTTLQEFIELVNVGVVAVDISGYKVVYTNSSNKTFDLVVFGIGTTLNAGAHALLVPIDPTNSFLPDISPKLTYIAPSSSGMAASSGKVSILDSNLVVLDEVQWANSQAAAVGDILFYAGDGKSISRRVVDGLVTVTVSPKNDFEVLTEPTPETGDPLPPEVIEPNPDPDPVVPVDPAPTPVDPPADPPAENPEETPVIEEPPTPVEQIPEINYLPILVNELYIDPESPETDAQDEWVELFNPNQEPVDISGYVVFTGANFTYKYIFPSGSLVAPGAYIVVTSGETPLSLSNGGGAAKVVSPNAFVFDEVTYAEAPAGQAWAKNTAGVWEWTTTATKESANIMTAPLPPVIKQAATSAAKAKKTTTTTAKVTAVKAATTKAAAKPKATAASTNSTEPELIAAPMPIPPWALAVLAVLAVLYVGYEYRFEAANSIYRFKNYRKYRR